MQPSLVKKDLLIRPSDMELLPVSKPEMIKLTIDGRFGNAINKTITGIL
ncbi:hypothetical protein GUJ14_01250 [Enterococcus hirae]|nr:hypothetical protein [Enterococcus hirae]EMF0091312.1 hypothetical protein [Enterococcus hirae]EMF0110386.1 hypothetical protein [Enterococcus hirae]EMF0130999.1 hypothetical protein [Enterococcus hirae]EMF0261186.1 hypothetical protein [Enterococcus hirae]EMF0277232.1 hypothetical protein [Enterococcus hirae]